MKNNNEYRRLKTSIVFIEKGLVKEVSLDKAFPDRKNSKTEILKARILNMENQLKLLEQGLTLQTYEEYKEEFMGQEPSEPSEPSKDDEIAELEAKLAALRGW